MTAPHDGYYNIYGPLCHPRDLLCKFQRLPKINLGDLILVMDAGAYFVPNQMNFSYPRAPAVLVDDGRHELIRGRESFEDIISLDVINL